MLKKQTGIYKKINRKTFKIFKTVVKLSKVSKVSLISLSVKRRFLESGKIPVKISCLTISNECVVYILLKYISGLVFAVYFIIYSFYAPKYAVIIHSTQISFFALP